MRGSLTSTCLHQLPIQPCNAPLCPAILPRVFLTTEQLYPYVGEVPQTIQQLPYMGQFPEACDTARLQSVSSASKYQLAPEAYKLIKPWSAAGLREVGGCSGGLCKFECAWPWCSGLLMHLC